MNGMRTFFSKRYRSALAASVPLLSIVVLVSGCPGFFSVPGLNGGITVRRIITTNPANTTTDFTFPMTEPFTDALGFRWDLSDDGHITDGGSDDFPDAFDRFMELELFVAGFAEHEFEPGTDDAMMEDGREIVIGPITQEGGLVITRKVFVSQKRGFCRWLDIFENTSDTDVTVEAENRGNLGSDEDNNNVFASSNGNTTLEEGDIWWINGQQFATDPTVAAFFCGTKDTEKMQDEIKIDYGKTQMVKAHSRNTLVTYLFQRSPDRSNPISLLIQEAQVVSELTEEMTELETFPDVNADYLEGMTADEVNDIRNCGGNVVAEGGAGSVTGNTTVTVTNMANGSTRTGTSRSNGSFGPLNVKGAAGDTVEVSAGGQSTTQVVP